ncbi:hypothetical protein U4E84_05585 [Halorubrum sp. AD140]|uniref:hypothetical protein n=1 Tax=Halorubrum sp. AD140 TaxID=3050073 RepID=UPI002ACCC8BC|nr:hypothetical protein [Halorubrum sp. AD140]MDZ5810816.1 hypothetical protein [Halorubrum sp. AD140]
MPSIRSILVSLLIGLVHAGTLIVVALALGYSIGPSEYTSLGMGWRYGGLVVMAAAPVWLVLRYRIFAPLLALTLTTGYVLGMELTPPGPTFSDVAELERLAEPTGIIVVENGLYIVRYMLNASIWLVGFLFLGLVEYTVRTGWKRLPAVPSLPALISIPASRGQAVRVATVGGVLHAAVMLWFALRLGLTVSGEFSWLMYISSTLGMWVLAAVPLYLLVRHLVVAPATVLTVFMLLTVQAEFTASPDDPHALYFGAWFLYLGLLLVVTGIEVGLRRLQIGQRLRTMT